MSKLAIVGASGLVGRNLLEQLQKREFKIDEIFSVSYTHLTLPTM